ncbi:hypothetical protein [uncultured Cycloclasticus sp.]|uniref:hypothetical protein n=1 Tax=uncultured Cycloclasticus sp. TaxID=172194 RepID=UPI002587BF30|nr:hypothetical protein [uncultured Cycloclasticus sp.]
MISKELIEELRSQFALDWSGIHGAPHWARVRVNGLILAKTTGANKQVVELFAFLHDSMRSNDEYDPQHGIRASSYAESLRGRFFELSDNDFALLQYACEGHSDGHMEADVTVQTCWDADRLDLGRVGIRPDINKLCTDVAKDSKVLEPAYARSICSIVTPE